jgi:hypothetical protein
MYVPVQSLAFRFSSLLQFCGVVSLDHGLLDLCDRSML